MTFNDLNLNSPLLKALDELGFTTPTTIQHKVFPVVMSGRDAVSYTHLDVYKRQTQYFKKYKSMKKNNAEVISFYEAEYPYLKQ